MLADSHCHLNYPGLVEDQAAVLARARAAGVTGMLGIATKKHEWADVIGVAERLSRSVDLHLDCAPAAVRTDSALMTRVASRLK